MEGGGSRIKDDGLNYPSSKAQQYIKATTHLAANTKVEVRPDWDEDAFPLVTASEEGLKVHSLNFFRAVFPSFRAEYASWVISDFTQLMVDQCRLYSSQLFGKEPTTGSLNNCKGRWYEMLFLDQALRALSGTEFASYDVFHLPPAYAGSEVWSMFQPSISRKMKSFNLHLSNPDFIVTRLSSAVADLKFQSVEPREDRLVARYEDRSFFGQLRPDDLITYIAVKTHTRPDRRYQHLYEVNALKAVSCALSLPVKYIAVSTERKDADDEIFRSPSIASIARGGQLSNAIDSVWTTITFQHIRDQVASLVRETSNSG